MSIIKLAISNYPTCMMVNDIDWKSIEFRRLSFFKRASVQKCHIILIIFSSCTPPNNTLLYNKTFNSCIIKWNLFILPNVRVKECVCDVSTHFVIYFFCFWCAACFSLKKTKNALARGRRKNKKLYVLGEEGLFWIICLVIHAQRSC